MRATVKDALGALSLKNCLVMVGIVVVSLLLIEAVGYVIWRRFPIPTLVICVAVLGWKIGRKIGHAGLSKVLNAASVVLGAFGVAIWLSALLDARLFPEIGYITWTVQTSMWGWILFNVWRAWRVLKTMPPDRLLHVTEGTEDIYAQMTYRQARIKQALEGYDKAKNLHFVIA